MNMDLNPQLILQLIRTLLCLKAARACLPELAGLLVFLKVGEGQLRAASLRRVSGRREQNSGDPLHGQHAYVTCVIKLCN